MNILELNSNKKTIIIGGGEDNFNMGIYMLRV